MIKIGKIFPENIFTILNRNVFNKFTKKFINKNLLINFKFLNNFCYRFCGAGHQLYNY